MDNKFTKVMSERTDRELLRITGVDSIKYEQEALSAARKELENRNIKIEKIDSLKNEINKEYENKSRIESNLASKSDRVAHHIIDRIFLIIIYTIANFFFSIIFSFFSEEILPVVIILYALVFFVLFYALQEYYFGKTLGKMYTKTKVVKVNGDKLTFADALSRSACRLIPFDWLSFLVGENGWHDQASDTKVIKDNIAV